MKKILVSFIIFLPFQLMALSPVSDKSTVIVTELEKFDPSYQIPATKGYQLRARKIIVTAGVSIAEHDHTTRPGIVVIESGEIIEYRGKESRLLKAGDSLVEDVSTVHAYKNVSDKDCVLVAFDLPAIRQ